MCVTGGCGQGSPRFRLSSRATWESRHTGIATTLTQYRGSLEIGGQQPGAQLEEPASMGLTEKYRDGITERADFMATSGRVPGEPMRRWKIPGPHPWLEGFHTDTERQTLHVGVTKGYAV